LITLKAFFSFELSVVVSPDVPARRVSRFFIEAGSNDELSQLFQSSDLRVLVTNYQLPST
jgi:hypothetical protein